ncbi:MULTISPECIES: antibiotic biosynthesis monooxygenase family protein [Streptomyces violaceusniger group]|uniref:ABM domain-containing protein n=2 Tax=Streptomyces rhizosphaericus TaxID=114699 RepID=A0ABN1SKP2_9ACTN|nr:MULTISPECIES: antibiotic biosynthesis monooxygenase family protein [Streptomyces violaceusniger group]
MITLNDLDARAPFMAQLNYSGDEPVTIVNTLVTPPGLEEDVIEAWRLDSEVMKTKGGNISQQLYRGPAGRVVTNVANWESAKDLQNAFMSPEFQALLTTYPDGSAAYPHLVRPVEVPGVCLGAPWDREPALATRKPATAGASAIEYIDLCPDVPLAEQLRATNGAFTLQDTFVVPEGAVDQAIHAYQEIGAYMKGHSGFIQAQLYRGLGSSNVLVDLAVWETAGALRDALSAPDFPALLAYYPAGTRCFQLVLHRAAVSNVCVN